MGNNLKKALLEEFEHYFIAHYGAYCQRHNLEKSDHTLLNLLWDMELISDAHVRKYTVQKEFDRLCRANIRKSEAVEIISSRFNLSQRTVWNILRSSDYQKQLPKPPAP